jgi:hypothetical protein
MVCLYGTTEVVPFPISSRTSNLAPFTLVSECRELVYSHSATGSAFFHEEYEGNHQ